MKELKLAIEEYFESCKELKYHINPKTEVRDGRERQVMGEFDYKPVLDAEGKHVKDYKCEPTKCGLDAYLIENEIELDGSEKVYKIAMLKINARMEARIRLQGSPEQLQELLN